MAAEVGILKENRYVRGFLRHYRIEYREFETAQEMLESEIPVLFCDTPVDIAAAVKNGKFIIVNHAVLMDFIGKPVQKAQGYDYVMKDFVFGERSFYIDEPVYCCDPSMNTVAPKLQHWIREQDFFDVGETFSPSNEMIPGACILAGRQVISLPWKLSSLDRLKKISLRPQYRKKSNRYSVRLLPNVDFSGLRQLLLALLRYAYRRQELWMPEYHFASIRMGDQDIEFIYPPEKIMAETKQKKKLAAVLRFALPIVVMLLFLGAVLSFTSPLFAAVMLGIMVGMCITLHICRKKRPSAMKYLLGAFAVAVIGINLLYNVRSLPTIYPLYRSGVQSRYIPDFLEEGLYADSLLQLLVKDKTVTVHDIGDAYEHPVYEYYEEGDPQVKYAVAHDPKYYYGRDYYRFFEKFAKAVQVDAALAAKDTFDFTTLRDSGRMSPIGFSNDMARYTFLINEDEIEQASYFWYDFVYREESPTMYVYMENELPSDCEELVALWDTENNLYIMSRTFYEQEVQVQ